jgi:hypothetical protein
MCFSHLGTKNSTCAAALCDAISVFGHAGALGRDQGGGGVAMWSGRGWVERRGTVDPEIVVRQAVGRGKIIPLSKVTSHFSFTPRHASIRESRVHCTDVSASYSYHRRVFFYER